MIIFATLSKPTAQSEKIFGRKYERVKIKLNSPIFDEENSQNEISQENLSEEISRKKDFQKNSRDKNSLENFQYEISHENFENENSQNGISNKKNSREEKIYFAEFFTATQTFHKNFSLQEAEIFLQENIGKTFRNCTERTEREEIIFMTSKKGKITRIAKPLKNESTQKIGAKKILGEKIALGKNQQNRTKNYIIQEGERVPFLQELGVMTSDGKIVAAKHAKFRQINRFLEFLDDIVPAVLERKKIEMKIVNENLRENFEEKELLENSENENLSGENSRGISFRPNEASGKISRVKIKQCSKMTQHLCRASHSQIEPIRILDFGSGKSYLTFAVHYYFSRKEIPFEITGVDLKKDVVEIYADLSHRLGLKNINFFCGNIAYFSEEKNPDIVITLHACDTATDFALDYALRRGAKAILSVPCCQHEINLQLQKKSNCSRNAAADISATQEILRPLLKYGIVRERFSALVTDCVRAEILEQAGYTVQILEFIDMEGTPKNLLIRAVLKNHAGKTSQDENERCVQKKHLEILDALDVTQTLCRLLREE